jgi:integration host factor subunit beta
MTKADLIAVVAEKLKFPWGRAELVVDQIFDSMVEALKRGEGIEIRGFGSFTIREYKAYEGRNPRTGETVHVRPKRLAFFKVGKELRERVNNGRGALDASDGQQDDDDDERDDGDEVDGDEAETRAAPADGAPSPAVEPQR